MSDFDISNVQDEDQVEITDLDPQNVGSGTSPSLVLLRFVRKIPFLANTRTKNTALALLICFFVLLFLVQPDLPSIQASRTRVPAQSSSLLRWRSWVAPVLYRTGATGGSTSLR